VLARLLAPGAWNQLALLLSVYLPAIAIGALGVPQSVVFFVVRAAPAERRAIALGSAMTLALLGGLSAALVVGGAAALAPGEPAWRWLALAIGGEIAASAAGPLLVARERVAAAAAWDALGGALVLAALCLPVALGGDVPEVVRALAAVGALRWLLALALLARIPSGRWSPRAGALRAQLGFALPLGLALGSAMLGRSLDKWWVALLAPAELGAYALAAQEIPLLAILPYAVSAASATRMVAAFHDGRLDDARALWLRQTASMSRLVVPIALGVVALAPELVEVLFAAAYAAATVPLQLYALILCHRVVEYGMALRAAGRPRGMLEASAVLLVVNAALGGPLVALLGATGAALASLVANALAWLYVLRLVARALGVGVRDGFPWATWLTALATSAALAAALRGVLDHGPLAAAGAATRLVVGATAYAGLAIVLGRARGRASG
jgi:O-antigen/teichoic acid export membrane protein